MEIKDIQRKLGVNPDGILGPITYGAIEKFQKANGLEANSDNIEEVIQLLNMPVMLFRFESTNKHTIGRGVWHGLDFYTMELPWKQNKQRESCIPLGTYKVAKHNSPKFGSTFWLKYVIGRSGILIHPGNKPSDLLGCIAPGRFYLNKQGMVTYSRVKLKEMMDKLPQRFNLEIHSTKLPTELPPPYQYRSE